jgi:hypothetical protein
MFMRGQPHSPLTPLGGVRFGTEYVDGADPQGVENIGQAERRQEWSEIFRPLFTS